MSSRDQQTNPDTGTLGGSDDELLDNAAFLVHSEPADVLAWARRARSATAVTAAQVYRTSVGRHRHAPPAARRDILAVDAARWGATDLSRRLAEVTVAHGASGAYRVDWATGSALHGALLWSGDVDSDDRNIQGVRTVTAGVLNGRPVAAATAYGDEGRVWDLATGATIARLRLDGGVAALGPVTVGGRGVLAVTGYTAVEGITRASVYTMDAASGVRLGTPFITYASTSGALATATVDGRSVALAGDGSSVRVWDLSEELPWGEPFEGHTGQAIEAAAITLLSGRIVAITGDTHGVVRTWDLRDRKEVAPPITLPERRISGLAVLALEGRTVLATWTADGPIQLRDLSGEILAELLPDTRPGSLGEALAVADLHGRPVLVAADRKGRVHVVDPASGRELCTPLPSYDGTPVKVSVADADGHPVAVVGGYGSSTVHAWDLAAACDAMPPAHMPPTPGTVTGLAVAKLRGREAIVTTHTKNADEEHPTRGESFLRVTDLADGSPAAPVAATDEGLRRLALTHVGTEPVAVVNWWDGPRLLRLPEAEDVGTTFRTRHHSQDHKGNVCALATGTHDHRPVIVTGGPDNEARAWYADDGTLLTALAGRGDGIVTAAAVGLLQGRAVAITAGSGFTPEVRVWWLGDGEPVCHPEIGHDGFVNAIALTRLGNALVAITGGEDHSVRVWDVSTGRPVRPALTGHTQPIRCVAVAEDDGHHPIAFTGSDDGTVRAWDLETGHERSCTHLPAPVTHIAITATHRIVAAFGDDIAVLSARELRRHGC
ncbi:WD40 repeat domain-containing protein [Yinghuangia soli]|uniref:WD40 repeat domain-containing protein n=1 Tax=Yinghuangia soli TaxID=2908204 RepID=A0AA41Q541_9ACTN|nr:WD40 repeat domain-containing protein [Yinghuangia soli]MCF2531382.1 WD40 repeat domain-containing protein [Yinghuangia soli]